MDIKRISSYKKGKKGVYVLIAQDSLNTLGYDTGGLDGIFGVKTRNSVISYQAKNNLSQDGIIGVNTWRKLMSDVVGKGAGDNTVM